MFTVYILKCSDGSLYTGYARDLAKRLDKHKIGNGSKYVRSRLPFELVYKEVFKTRSNAMKRESAIKKLSKTEKNKLL